MARCEASWLELRRTGMGLVVEGAFYRVGEMAVMFCSCFANRT